MTSWPIPALSGSVVTEQSSGQVGTLNNSRGLTRTTRETYYYRLGRAANCIENIRLFQTSDQILSCIVYFIPSFSYQSADIRGAARCHGLSVLDVRPPFACVPSFFPCGLLEREK